jgi:hypothetical protein
MVRAPAVMVAFFHDLFWLHLLEFNRIGTADLFASLRRVPS